MKVHRFLRKIINSSVRLRSLWGDSYLRLRLNNFSVNERVNQRSVSVAIPFFNNASIGHLALFNILKDERISEVVILDDCSELRQFEKLRRKLLPFRHKVKLYRREENWGAFANKIQAVDLCSSAWVILLDYDNTLTKKYLDAMFSVENWDQDRIYCSDFAYPHFDFRELSGTTIDFACARRMATNKSFNHPFFNDGNYLLFRESYVKVLKPYLNYRVAASDVVFANYIWMANSGKLEVVRDSQYIHRVHCGSIWLNNQGESLGVLSPIMRAFKDGIEPSSGWMDRELEKASNNWKAPAPVSLSKPG